MPYYKEARNSGDRVNPVTSPEGWGFSQGNNLNLPFLPGLKAGASWSNGVKMTPPINHENPPSPGGRGLRRELSRTTKGRGNGSTSSP